MVGRAGERPATSFLTSSRCVLPDGPLLWRAVARLAYTYIQKRPEPSPMCRRFSRMQHRDANRPSLRPRQKYAKKTLGVGVLGSKKRSHCPCLALHQSTSINVPFDDPFARIPVGRAHSVGHPWLPLDPATALQHLRQEACEDSDVMLRGHKGPRR